MTIKEEIIYKTKKLLKEDDNLKIKDDRDPREPIPTPLEQARRDEKWEQARQEIDARAPKLENLANLGPVAQETEYEKFIQAQIEKENAYDEIYYPNSKKRNMMHVMGGINAKKVDEKFPDSYADWKREQEQKALNIAGKSEIPYQSGFAEIIGNPVVKSIMALGGIAAVVFFIRKILKRRLAKKELDKIKQLKKSKK